MTGNKHAIETLARFPRLSPKQTEELVELRRSCFASEDFREGVRAFGEKRAAEVAGTLSPKALSQGSRRARRLRSRDRRPDRADRLADHRGPDERADQGPLRGARPHRHRPAGVDRGRADRLGPRGRGLRRHADPRAARRRRTRSRSSGQPASAAGRPPTSSESPSRSSPATCDCRSSTRPPTTR